MKDKLLSNPSHVAKIGYNSFDMSQIADFTAAPGMLLPVYYDYLNPGDKVRCNARVKLRTQPLDSAAEFSATIRCDWFAVPIEQLFKYFGNQYYNIQDIDTNFIDPTTASFNQYLPFHTMTNLYSYIYGMMTGSPFIAVNYSYAYPFAPYEGVDYSSSLTENQEVCMVNDTLRLLDCLGIPFNEMFDDVSWTAQGAASMSIVPFLGAAYQKIYFDYYRLSDRQVNDPKYYNLDKMVLSSNQSYFTTNYTYLSYIYRLHYIPYKKDFMTNTFVSPLQGAADVGSLGNTQELFNTWLSSNGVSTGTPDSTTGLSLSTSSPSTTYVRGSSSSTGANSYVYRGQLNANSIRSLFAVEKALEITRRSGKHYDAQTLAHWGVKVPEGIAGEVIYLGSQTQPLVVGDVVSTAASTFDSVDEPIGTIKGKGYSSANIQGAVNNPVSFEAKSHCVLMCVFCVQPDVRYTQKGLDKLNTLVNVADWLHPEYDNLGMQPLYQYQLASAVSDYSTVVDWQYAYSELKHKFNRVFAGVHGSSTLSSWVPQIDLDSTSKDSYRSLYRFYVEPDWLNGSLSYEFYYLIPGYVTTDGSSDFQLQEAGPYATIYAQDPFIVSAAFDVQKASKMSTYSLTNI